MLHDDLNDLIIDNVKAVEKNAVAEEMKKYLKNQVKPLIVKLFQEYEI